MIHRVSNQVTLIGRVPNDPTTLGDEIGIRFDLAVTDVPKTFAHVFLESVCNCVALVLAKAKNR